MHTVMRFIRRQFQQGQFREPVQGTLQDGGGGILLLQYDVIYLVSPAYIRTRGRGVKKSRNFAYTYFVHAQALAVHFPPVSEIT